MEHAEHLEQQERAEHAVSPRRNGRARHYRKDVHTIDVDARVREVALRMRDKGVGALVVTEDGCPVGMVTDRDLLEGVIAQARDVAGTTVRDIMRHPLETVAGDATLEDVMGRMADRGIRRVVVLEDGKISGLVSLDDALVALAEELQGLAYCVRFEFDTGQVGARIHEAHQELGALFGKLFDQIERLGGDARDALHRSADAIRSRLRVGGGRDER